MPPPFIEQTATDYRLSRAGGGPRTAKVLILDDERFDRHRMARLCSGLDRPIDMLAAKSLCELEHHLEEHAFDLILLDYGLPDGTGLDALHMVRLSPRNHNAPTLMISSLPLERISAEARALGCRAVLSKDSLSAGTLEAAVSQSLAPPAALPPQKDSYSAAEVEALMSACASRCAQDIKPMVSRLMRQLRGLRAQTQHGEEAALQSIEQNCMALWAYLIEQEGQMGAALMRELAVQPRRPVPVRPARPPSPFARRSH